MLTGSHKIPPCSHHTVNTHTHSQDTHTHKTNTHTLTYPCSNHHMLTLSQSTFTHLEIHTLAHLCVSRHIFTQLWLTHINTLTLSHSNTSTVKQNSHISIFTNYSHTLMVSQTFTFWSHTFMYSQHWPRFIFSHTPTLLHIHTPTCKTRHLQHHKLTSQTHTLPQTHVLTTLNPLNLQSQSPMIIHTHALRYIPTPKSLTLTHIHTKTI